MNRHGGVSKVTSLATNLVLVIASFSMPSAAQSTAKESLQLEAKLDGIFAEWKSADSPGAAVAVVRDGTVIYRKGFGSAELEYPNPITPATIFHAASLSKQFTAFAITLLEERGALSLDDDIRTYLPEVPDFGKKVTIRHLLHHTSGLRDHTHLLALSHWQLDDTITQRDILGLVTRQRELNFPPGDRQLYSNTGYVLLAEIVARVTKTPYDRWTRDNIFGPFGMSASHFKTDHEEVVRNRAHAYYKSRESGWKSDDVNYEFFGSTNLQTSADDLASWLINFDQKRPGAIGAFQRLMNPGTINDGSSILYARGLVVGQYKGLRTFSHAGVDGGFRAALCYFPDVSFGAAILANASSVDAYRLALQIADVCLAGQFQGVNPAPSTQPIEKPFKMPPANLKSIPGVFWNDAMGALRRIVAEKDQLFYERTKDNRSLLRPLASTEFRMMGTDVDVRVAFSELKNGLYDAMTVTQGADQPRVFKRTEPYVLTKEMMTEYAGRYYSPELDVHYDLVPREEGLTVRAAKFSVEGFSTDHKDVFLTRAWPFSESLRLNFTRDDNGAVNGFRLSSNRVLNLRFTRQSN